MFNGIRRNQCYFLCFISNARCQTISYQNSKEILNRVYNQKEPKLLPNPKMKLGICMIEIYSLISNSYVNLLGNISYILS